MAFSKRQPRTLAYVVLSTFFTLRACTSCVGGPDWLDKIKEDTAPATAQVGYDDGAPKNPWLVYERVLNVGPNGKPRTVDATKPSEAGYKTVLGRVGDLGKVGTMLFGGTLAPGASPLSAIPPSAARAPASEGRQWGRGSDGQPNISTGDRHGECSSHKWIAHCGVGGCNFTNCQ